MPRTPEMNYIQSKFMSVDKLAEPISRSINCKACETPMSSGIGLWVQGYCPDCSPAVRALMYLYFSDHRRHFTKINFCAKKEAMQLWKERIPKPVPNSLQPKTDIQINKCPHCWAYFTSDEESPCECWDLHALEWSGDNCRYCGGQLRRFRGGYKGDETGAVCQDCGTWDMS
jgi:hypothetical protein